MGKYMKKSKPKGELTLVESTTSNTTTAYMGFRTRAKTLALQKLHPQPELAPTSDSYLQLRSRRLYKPYASVLSPKQNKHPNPKSSIANPARLRLTSKHKALKSRNHKEESALHENAEVQEASFGEKMFWILKVEKYELGENQLFVGQKILQDTLLIRIDIGEGDALQNPRSFKVHSKMCIGLTKLVDRISRIFPDLEEARPRSSLGIKSLCLLNNAIGKAKLLLQHCSECSKLYLVSRIIDDLECTTFVLDPNKEEAKWVMRELLTS